MLLIPTLQPSGASPIYLDYTASICLLIFRPIERPQPNLSVKTSGADETFTTHQQAAAPPLRQARSRRGLHRQRNVTSNERTGSHSTTWNYCTLFRSRQLMYIGVKILVVMMYQETRSLPPQSRCAHAFLAKQLVAVFHTNTNQHKQRCH